jgi:hypothetical protein
MALKKVHNGHSSAQISQKSRWMALGMIASAMHACKWLVSSRNRFRVTDPSTQSQLYVAMSALESAMHELRNKK